MPRYSVHCLPYAKSLLALQVSNLLGQQIQTFYTFTEGDRREVGIWQIQRATTHLLVRNCSGFFAAAHSPICLGLWCHRMGLNRSCTICIVDETSVSLGFIYCSPYSARIKPLVGPLQLRIGEHHHERHLQIYLTPPRAQIVRAQLRHHAG
jgi:hypothetical protein